MDAELLELLKTWNISFFIQNRRMDGAFHQRYMWRAQKFKGLKEYSSELNGFEFPYQAMQNAIETLKKVINTQHNESIKKD